MRLYIVGENRAASEVKVKAYDSEDAWSVTNPGGLTYQGMLGNHFTLVLESSRKEDVRHFIEKNYPSHEDWRVLDCVNEAPLYKRGQYLGQNATVLRRLRKETLTSCGVGEWKELLDEKHNIKKEFYTDLVYMVCWDYHCVVMTGLEISRAQLLGMKFILSDQY